MPEEADHLLATLGINVESNATDSLGTLGKLAEVINALATAAGRLAASFDKLDSSKLSGITESIPASWGTPTYSRNLENTAVAIGQLALSLKALGAVKESPGLAAMASQIATITTAAKEMRQELKSAETDNITEGHANLGTGFLNQKANFEQGKMSRGAYQSVVNELADRTDLSNTLTKLVQDEQAKLSGYYQTSTSLAKGAGVEQIALAKETGAVNKAIFDDKMANQITIEKLEKGEADLVIDNNKEIALSNKAVADNKIADIQTIELFDKAEADLVIRLSKEKDEAERISLESRLADIRTIILFEKAEADLVVKLANEKAQADKVALESKMADMRQVELFDKDEANAVVKGYQEKANALRVYMAQVRAGQAEVSGLRVLTNEALNSPVGSSLYVAGLQGRQMENSATKGSEEVSSTYNGMNRGSGMDALIAGGTILAGLIAASKAASDFNRDLSKVYATAGETMPLDRLSQSLFKLSSQFGITPDNLTLGLYKIEGAGYHGAEGLQVLGQAAQFSRGAQIDMATTGKLISETLLNYKLHASDAAHVTDVFTVALSRAESTGAQFAPALQNILQPAANLGVTYGEAASALAAVSSEVKSAATAGTYLKNLFVGLNDPSPAIIKAAKNIDIANHDTALSFIVNKNAAEEFKRVGMAGVLDEIGKAVHYNAQALDDLFPDMRKNVAANVLLSDTGNRVKSIINDTTNAQGASAKAAKIQKQSMEDLNAAFQALEISVGQKIIPAITKATGELKSLVDEFNKLSPSTQQFIVDTAGIAGVVLSAAGAFNILAGAIKGIGELTGLDNLIGGLTKLGPTAAGGVAVEGIEGVGVAAGTAATGPIVALLLTVAALTTAWVTDYGKMRESMHPFFADVEDSFKSAGDSIKTFITSVIPELSDSIKTLEPIFTIAFKSIGKYLTYWFDNIKTQIALFWTFATGAFKVQLDIITLHWNKVWDDLSVAASNDLNAVVNRINAIIPGAGKAMDALGTTISNAWHKSTDGLFEQFSDNVNKLFAGDASSPLEADNTTGGSTFHAGHPILGGSSAIHPTTTPPSHKNTPELAAFLKSLNDLSNKSKGSSGNSAYANPAIYHPDKIKPILPETISSVKAYRDGVLEKNIADDKAITLAKESGDSIGALTIQMRQATDRYNDASAAVDLYTKKLIAAKAAQDLAAGMAINHDKSSKFDQYDIISKKLVADENKLKKNPKDTDLAKTVDRLKTQQAALADSLARAKAAMKEANGLYSQALDAYNAANQNYVSAIGEKGSVTDDLLNEGTRKYLKAAEDTYEQAGKTAIARLAFEDQLHSAITSKSIPGLPNGMQLGTDQVGDLVNELSSLQDLDAKSYASTTKKSAAQLKSEDIDEGKNLLIGFQSAVDDGSKSIQQYIVDLTTMQSAFQNGSSQYNTYAEAIKSANKELNKSFDETAKKQADAFKPAFEAMFQKNPTKAVREAYLKMGETYISDQATSGLEDLFSKNAQAKSKKSMSLLSPDPEAQTWLKQYQADNGVFYTAVSLFTPVAATLSNALNNFTISQRVAGMFGVAGAHAASAGIIPAAGAIGTAVGSTVASGGSTALAIGTAAVSATKALTSGLSLASGVAVISQVGSLFGSKSSSASPKTASVQRTLGGDAGDVSNAIADGISIASAKGQPGAVGLQDATSLAGMAGDAKSLFAIGGHVGGLLGAVSAAAPYLALAASVASMFGPTKKTPSFVGKTQFGDVFKDFGAMVDSGYTGQSGLRGLIGQTSMSAAGVTGRGAGGGITVNIHAGAFNGVSDPVGHANIFVQQIQKQASAMSALDAARRSVKA